MRSALLNPRSRPRAMASWARESATASLANAAGVSRNILRDIWSKTSTAASAEELFLRPRRELRVQFAKAAADSCVEGSVLLEPLLGLSFLKPELEDFADPGLRRGRWHWRSETRPRGEAPQPGAHRFGASLSDSHGE